MKPSIGRIVLFRPTNVVTAQAVQAALIAYVHSDTCVNLAVFDNNGVVSTQTSVQLVAPGQPKPEFGMYCEWPPHQVGNTKIDISQLGGSQENIDELTRIIKSGDSKILVEGLSTMSHPSDAGIEAEIVAKGLTAPRVTPDRIAVLMARVQFKFHVEANSTFCHAFLDGEFFLATGHSACVSKENFDAEIGQKIAKANVMKPANDKLWELEGYALRVQLTL